MKPYCESIHELAHLIKYNNLFSAFLYLYKFIYGGQYSGRSSILFFSKIRSGHFKLLTVRAVRFRIGLNYHCKMSGPTSKSEMLKLVMLSCIAVFSDLDFGEIS